jgi:hypothetical protein
MRDTTHGRSENFLVEHRSFDDSETAGSLCEFQIRALPGGKVIEYGDAAAMG